MVKEKDKEADAKKEGVRVLIEALEKIRIAFNRTEEAFEQNQVLADSLPFLKIQVDGTIKTIEEYIKAFKKVKL